MQLVHSLPGQGWGPLSLPLLGDPGRVRKGILSWENGCVRGSFPEAAGWSVGRVRTSHPVHRDSHLRNNNLNQTAWCARHCSESINSCNSHEEMLSHFIDGNIGGTEGFRKLPRAHSQ